MDDLISRKTAIEWFFRPYSNEESYSNIDVERALNAIPTVDAAPVVHGRWVYEHGDPAMIPCSVCGYQVFRYNNTHYCPNCGAKMDERGKGVDINE